MKGIYLTEEGKREIESKIVELEQYYPLDLQDDFIHWGKRIALQEILSLAIIIPTEESLNIVDDKLLDYVVANSKKEAVVEAINQFLIWYNEKQII
jgi:hypothetical protein